MTGFAVALHVAHFDGIALDVRALYNEPISSVTGALGVLPRCADWSPARFIIVFLPYVVRVSQSCMHAQYGFN